jgi:hypothetical protein
VIQSQKDARKKKVERKLGPNSLEGGNTPLAIKGLTRRGWCINYRSYRFEVEAKVRNPDPQGTLVG